MGRVGGRFANGEIGSSDEKALLGWKVGKGDRLGGRKMGRRKVVR